MKGLESTFCIDPSSIAAAIRERQFESDGANGVHRVIEGIEDRVKRAFRVTDGSLQKNPRLQKMASSACRAKYIREQERRAAKRA